MPPVTSDMTLAMTSAPVDLDTTRNFTDKTILQLIVMTSDLDVNVISARDEPKARARGQVSLRRFPNCICQEEQLSIVAS